MDLTKLSDADLLALQAGDLSKVSDAGLAALSGQPTAPTPFQQQMSRPVVGPAGILEAGVNALTGMGASSYGGLKALGTLATGGSLNDAVNTLQQTQQERTYQPRTEEGKSASSIVAQIFGLPSQAGEWLGGKVGAALGNEAAGEAIGKVAPDVIPILMGGVRPVKSIATTKYTGAGLPSMVSRAEQAAPAVEIKQAAQAAKAEAASNADWQNSARIDTVKEASQLPHPPSLNPAMSNPTMSNKVTAGLTGMNSVDVAMSKANKNVWGNNAKADMGIPQQTPLTSTKPLEVVRKIAAKPYEEIAQMGKLTPDAEVLSALDSIKVPELISDPTTAGKVQAMIDRAKNMVDEGMTGAQALEHIKQLRAEADNVMSVKKAGNKVEPVDLAEAGAKLDLSNALETLVQANIKDAGLLQRFKDARVKIAKSYAYQKAIDFDTGYLNPAKLPEDMTGIGATMRKVAANFPNAANVNPTLLGTFGAHLSRVGPAGALGFGIGSMVGAPYMGSIIGAGLGDVAGMLNTKRMTGRGFQERNAIPADRRIYPVEMNPAQAPYKPAAGSNQVAPYDYSQQTYPSGYTPNFAAPRPAPAELHSLTFDAQTGKILPQDASNTVRVPNDRAMAEYLRAQEAVRIAAEKEAALAELGGRNAKAAAARESAIAREKLMDAVEQLQEKLGNPRPTNLGGQGPKTRAFKRGMLTGENQ